MLSRQVNLQYPGEQLTSVLAISRKKAQETAGRKINSREVSILQGKAVTQGGQEIVPALPLTMHDSFVWR